MDKVSCNMLGKINTSKKWVTGVPKNIDIKQDIINNKIISDSAFCLIGLIIIVFPANNTSANNNRRSPILKTDMMYNLLHNDKTQAAITKFVKFKYCSIRSLI